MGQSKRVRFSDLRRAYRLIHECRDLGHDREAWGTHLAGCLPALVGDQVAMVSEIRFGQPGGTPHQTFLFDHGWLCPRDREYWFERYIVQGGFAQASTFQKIATLPGPMVTRTRAQLMDDAPWYRSTEYQDMNRAVGTDDFLASIRWERDPPSMFGVMNVRPLGEKKHGERERRLIHLFMDELSRHLGKTLALEAGGIAAAFPPRLRLTLECLLEGDSEKQVAARLRLSRHTVHDYVTELYRRLGVRSRAELMARCLRRRS